MPSPGDLPDAGIEPVSLMPPALAGGFFTTSATWDAPVVHTCLLIYMHTLCVPYSTYVCTCTHTCVIKHPLIGFLGLSGFILVLHKLGQVEQKLGRDEQGINKCLKAMAPRSSALAWRIPWTEEPGGLQSMGSRRVGHG